MLKQELLNELYDRCLKDKNYIVKRRIFNKVPILDLVTDASTNIDMNFSVNIKTHNVSDQKNSGRCWSFAGMNILRERVIEKCNLDNIELSGSFIAFYDKLERFNNLMERIIKLKKEGKDEYDRDLSSILENGIGDGGFFTQFANLVDKYGIVPASIYPETFTSSNTYEVNQILSRLLRKFYIDLDNNNNSDLLKESYLEKVYIVISNVYGIPPKEFNFEYTDKEGKYNIDNNLSPKTFYEKYICLNLKNDYIEVSSFKDKRIDYNKLYEGKFTSRISGEKDNIVLNLDSNSFEKLILKQIKEKEPVYFCCATTSKRIDGVWLDILDRYGDLFDLDLTMDRNSIMTSNGLTGCHAMIFTGVNIVNGKPNKWKVENSWGTKYGDKGYYIATNDWVHKYVFRAVINKKYLSESQLKLLKQKPIIIKNWDRKF